MVVQHCVDNSWPVAALTPRSEARYWLRIAISAYHTSIRCPRFIEGFPLEYCHAVRMEKLEWLVYPTVKKFGRYLYSF